MMGMEGDEAGGGGGGGGGTRVAPGWPACTRLPSNGTPGSPLLAMIQIRFPAEHSCPFVCSMAAEPLPSSGYSVDAPHQKYWLQARPHAEQAEDPAIAPA